MIKVKFHQGNKDIFTDYDAIEQLEKEIEDYCSLHNCTSEYKNDNNYVAKNLYDREIARWVILNIDLDSDKYKKVEQTKKSDPIYHVLIREYYMDIIDSYRDYIFHKKHNAINFVENDIKEIKKLDKNAKFHRDPCDVIMHVDCERSHHYRTIWSIEELEFQD